MASIKNQLIEMIDCLPDQDQVLVFEIVKRFMHDDIATADDIRAIQAAHEEYIRGETIDHNDIDWS